MIVVVHEPRPFVYLATPKAASNTVRTLIYKNWARKYETFDRATMIKEHRSYARRWRGYPWFASIRNPLSRAVSIWSEYRDLEIPAHATPQFREYFDAVKAADTFENALHDARLADLKFWTEHTAMISFLALTPQIDGHLRVEHLADDLRSLLLPHVGGTLPPIPTKRIGGYRERGDWRQQYTPGCFAKLMEHIPDDFVYCRVKRLYAARDLEDPAVAA